MITDVKKLSALEKILKSKEFNESKNYQELLRFLVRASMSGEMPKESAIALAVFGKDLTKELSSDTTVRVYIHNLRKKLDTYYLNEGKDDPIQLSIPKGHYLVLFLESGVEIHKGKSYWAIACFALLLLIFILLNLNYWTRRNPSAGSNIPKNNPIWKEYFQSNLPILIVFGDYFVYRDVLSNPTRYLYVRDIEINSIADLDSAISRGIVKPKSNGNRMHSYLGKCAPWSLYELLPKLINHSKIPEIKLLSGLQWEDLNKYNIIFVGSYKTLGMMKNALSKLRYQYIIVPNLLTIQDSTGQTYHYSAQKQPPQNEYELDYAIVAKIPGPNNNVMMFFISTHDIGQITTVRHFTNPSTLLEVTDQFLQQSPGGKSSPYFFTVFEVTGFERTGFNTKLLHFFPVDKNYKIERP